MFTRRELPVALAACLLGACATDGFARLHAEEPRAEPPRAAPAQGAEGDADLTIHPVLVAYRQTLRDWLEPEERRALDEVPVAGTMGGDSQRLRYIAADRTIRELLPEALEAQQDPRLAEHAERLRALPPVMNRDTDAVAQPVVEQAMRALRAHRGGRVPAAPPPPGAPVEREMFVTEGGLVLPPEELDALETVAREEVDPEAARAYADALAEYAEAYSAAFGSSPMQADAATAAAADAIDAGFLLRRVVDEYGVDRQSAVRSALGLLGEMANAARRRERMPLPASRRDDTVDP